MVCVPCVLQSFREFKEADVETWMKSVNIDIYWEYFKQGCITSGKALAAVVPETLVVSPAEEPCYFHCCHLPYFCPVNFCGEQFLLKTRRTKIV